MANADKSSNSGNSRQKAPRSLSIFSYLMGLAGLSFAITLAVWTYVSLSAGGVMLPLLGKRSSLMMYLVLFTISLQCSVVAAISGAIASRRAREQEQTGYRRWRMGFYMGVCTMVLLAISFVVLAAFSIHFLMYQSQFHNRMI